MYFILHCCYKTNQKEKKYNNLKIKVKLEFYKSCIMLSYIAEIVECHKICMVIMVVCCCFMHTHKNVMI